MNKYENKVDGITCYACIASIEKELNQNNSISNITLPLHSKVLSFDYESDVDIKVIEQQINNLGFKVTDNSQKDDSYSDEFKQLYNNTIISLVFGIPLFLIAMSHMFNYPLPSIIDMHKYPLNFALIQFMLTLPIIIINKHYFINGFKSLINKHPNMDALVAIGSSAALIYGIITLFLISTAMSNNDMANVMIYVNDLYFETAAMIIVLINIGKTLEAKSKKQTFKAINKLIDLNPTVATVEKDGVQHTVLVEDLQINDICIVKAGEKISADAIIIEGSTMVDESMISGESVPVNKKVDDKVIQATLNLNGNIKIKVLKLSKDSQISQIIKLMEQTSASKADIANIADKITLYFVPTVIIISLITLVTWLIMGYPLTTALNMFIAVLVISCPCALGLATPTAIVVSSGKAALNHILIKSGKALENACKVDTIILDKTNTMTYGKPDVSDTYFISDNALQIAYSLELKSSHPFASPICDFSKLSNITPLVLNSYQEVIGYGINGTLENNDTISITNYDYIKLHNIDDSDINNMATNYLKMAKTILYISHNQKVIGLITLTDKLKETTIKAIELFKQSNIDVIMLTGDNYNVAKQIADECNITNFKANCKPEDKHIVIKQLQSENHKVMMIGDGINDGPSLALADVSVAISNGSDIAIESSDIVLLSNDLIDAYNAINLSKQTLKNIKQNLFFAFIYNIICIPIAAGLLFIPFGIKLNPMIASISMSLSSICVVTNALRLNSFKMIKLNKKKEEIIMNNLKTISFTVSDMMCNHCKMTIDKVLVTFNLDSYDINIDTKIVTVTTNDETLLPAIKSAISDKGFKVQD